MPEDIELVEHTEAFEGEGGIEALGHLQPAKPSLSTGFIQSQQDLLADPAFCRDFPQHAEMIRRTLDEALEAIHYQPPPADSRTAAQIVHDRQHGVTFDPEGAVQLPPDLLASITRDADGEPQDPARIAAQLEGAHLNPKDVIADAKFALEKAKSKVAVTSLSAHALGMLAAFGAHLRKHAETRPR